METKLTLRIRHTHSHTRSLDKLPTHLVLVGILNVRNALKQVPISFTFARCARNYLHLNLPALTKEQKSTPKSTYYILKILHSSVNQINNFENSTTNLEKLRKNLIFI